jgi:hypothetical protein
MADTTSSGMMDTNENAHRNLADDTRFRPLNEQHERFYYTDPETGESRWLRLEEALEMKAELDRAAMQREDAKAGENA